MSYARCGSRGIWNTGSWSAWASSVKMSCASICACAPQARKESGLGLNTDGSAWGATDLAAQGSDEGMSPAGAGVDVDGPASCCTATFVFSALDLPTTSGRPICACGTDCAVKRTAAWACECAMHWSKARSSAWHARMGREHDLHGVGFCGGFWSMYLRP